MYSRCPKSERSVWKIEQNLVRILDVLISDNRVVWFFGSIGFTINVQNPNVQLVESINRTSEIRTKWFRFQTLSEMRTVWKWDNFVKRQNPNVRISDTYCTVNV